ncbi:MAG: hypothetical protein M5U34_23465 [Chloroflexi bacterium]|nr:hypothetical protein [Chloroflexota bacterium]
MDEIACQIDFGVPSTQVLASLPLLNQVKTRPRRPLPMPISPSLA